MRQRQHTECVGGPGRQEVGVAVAVGLHPRVQHLDVQPQALDPLQPLEGRRLSAGLARGGGKDPARCGSAQWSADGRKFFRGPWRRDSGDYGPFETDGSV